MIGWENNQGGFYILKLFEIAEKNASDISDTNDAIGDVSDLTTTDKTDLVAAINELVTRVKALEDAT